MTTTIERATARGVISWDASDDEWLFRRRKGITGSDIAAILGFSGYATPWEVWADKTGVHDRDNQGSDAAQLGTDLEPWLLGQAPALLGVPVERSPFRTYAHATNPWQMYSPDGLCADGRLFEAKTAGLATGFGPPTGWDDNAVPLGYEFQVRWGMHILDAPAAEIVALVANRGLVHRTITRDVAIEADLVDQVTEWWHTHVTGGAEPALGAGDAATIVRRYPTSAGTDIDLSDTDADNLRATYRAALARESAARADKEATGAAIKALMGTNGRALIGDRVIATWNDTAGKVDYTRMVADLAELAGVPVPNADLYRKPSTRTLLVKDA